MSPPPGNPPKEVFGPVSLTLQLETSLIDIISQGLDCAVRSYGLRFSPRCEVLRRCHYTARDVSDEHETWKGNSETASSNQADQALQLYYGQLALNMLWTPLFFGGEFTCSTSVYDYLPFLQQPSRRNWRSVTSLRSLGPSSP